MTRFSDFGYAQARLQARNGMLPDAAGWRRLESVISLPHFLQMARNTPLRPWVLHLGSHNSSHEMERSLRQQFRTYVKEVASWLPHPWAPSLLWVARIIDLPALHHLLSGEAAPGWMADDSALRAFATDVPALQLQALSESDCAPLLEGWGRGEPLGQVWHRQWVSLWPADAGFYALALRQLAGTVGDYHSALVAPGLGDSRHLFNRLEGELRRLFRRHPHQPAAAFTHLGLVVLTLQRLRAALLKRALFPETMEQSA